MRETVDSLFREFANLLAGTWHHHKSDILIMLDLAQAPNSPTAITIQKDDIALIGNYRLKIDENRKRWLITVEIYERRDYFIQVLTATNLIVRDDAKGIYAYEKKSNEAFADETILNCFQ